MFLYIYIRMCIIIRKSIAHFDDLEEAAKL